MKLNHLALASFLIVGTAHANGAQSFKKLTGEANLRKMIVDHSELKDPFTVQFRNVFVREVHGDTKSDPSKHVYCGELNAKNSYGGYVGWSRFLAHDVTDSPSVTIVDDDSDAIVVNLLCKDAPTGG